MTGEPRMESSDRSYVVIITARDEARYLRGTIDSIAGQTLLPVEMVIVNDGSRDETGAIADAAAEKHAWIHVVHRDDRGGQDNYHKRQPALPKARPVQRHDERAGASDQQHSWNR